MEVERRDARRALLADESGNAIVEFAVLLPLLLLILFGVLDFARALNYMNDGTHLANEGARWAVVNSNQGGATLQQQLLAQGDTDEFRTNSTVCVKFSATRQVGDPVEVKVLTTFNWLPFISSVFVNKSTTATIAGSAVMRIEQSPDASYIPSGDGGTAAGGRTCP